MTEPKSSRVPEALAAALRLRHHLAARAAAHDVAGQFPSDDFDDLRHAGLMGAMVPPALGGAGAGFADYVEIAMALATGNGATALIFNMHSSIIGALSHTSDDFARLLGAGDDWFETRDELLRSAAGGAFFAVAMSERGAGARLDRMTTTYEKAASGYRIVGSKAFVSGAGHADAYLLAARSKDDGDAQISHFLVPAGAGITVDPTWDAMGMRATGSHDVHFDTEVPESALLGGVAGLALPLAESMPQWLVASYAAVYIGVAQSAIDAAVNHLTERGLTSLEAARSKVGRADARLAAAMQTVREAARLIDARPGEAETNRWIYRAKLVAGDTAMAVASDMLEVAGTSATRKGHPLERIFRDARCGALQPASSAVCASWLGATALGASASSQVTTSS